MSARAATLLAALPQRARDLLDEVAVLAAPGRAALVGGAVRDLLRGLTPRDLDVTLEGDAGAVARGVADGWGGEVAAHGRFQTASVWIADGLRVDLATCRTERYTAPGALPEVAAAPLELDLARRDFTIHAMALVLTPQGAGPLLDPAGGRADLEAGVLRVQHAGSFRDDPTRLLRAVRYATRLGLAMADDTARWRDEAVADDVAAPVSGDRLMAEWALLAAEDDPVAQLRALRRDGVYRVLGLPEIDAGRLAAAAERVRRGWAIPGAGLDAAEACLAAWLGSAGEGARQAALERLGVTPQQHGWYRAPGGLRDWTDPVECHEALHRMPGPTRAALVATHGDPALAALRWYAEELRWVQPLLRGRDLLALGLAPGPRVREVLRDVFRGQLRGEVRDRDDALGVARAALRGELDG